MSEATSGDTLATQAFFWRTLFPYTTLSDLRRSSGGSSGATG